MPIGGHFEDPFASTAPIKSKNKCRFEITKGEDQTQHT